MTTTKPSQRIAEIIRELVRKKHWDVGTTRREALEQQAAADPFCVISAILDYLDEVHGTQERTKP
jgi:hypothetical protein